MATAHPRTRLPRHTTLAWLCRRARRGGRHVVHDRGPDAGDLVGRHGDAVSRAADADTQVHVAPRPRHGPPRRRSRGSPPRSRRPWSRGRRPRGPADASSAFRISLRANPAWSEPKATRMEAESTERAGGARGVSRYDPGRMALYSPHTGGRRGRPGHHPSRSPHRPGRAARASRIDGAGTCGPPPRTPRAPHRGGRPRPGHALIRRADSIRVVVPLAWRTVNPALLVAAELGFDADTTPPELMLTAVGGNTPQALAARRLPCHLPRRPRRRPGDRGRGACTPAPRPGAIRRNRRVNWSSQPDRGDTAARPCSGRSAPGATDLERSRGIILPDPGLPAVRERAARRERMDTGRAPGAHRLAVVPLQRGGRIQPLRLDPPRLSPRGDHRHPRRTTA